LQTAALPPLDFEFHVDDDAADALFQGVIAPLPKRDPPGRIYWPKPWAMGLLVSLMLVAAIGLALLRLSWIAEVGAAVLLCVAISILWHACRPIFEEKRPEPSSRREKES
jgi:hypothetical protein